MGEELSVSTVGGGGVHDSWALREFLKKLLSNFLRERNKTQNWFGLFVRAPDGFESGKIVQLSKIS